MKKFEFDIKKIIFTLVLASIIFYFIFKGIDFETVYFYLKGMNLFYFFIAFLIFYLSMIPRTLLWTTLIRIVKHDIPFKDMFYINFMSLFFNCIAPSKLGEVYKIWACSKYDISKSKNTLLFFIARILDVVSILILLLFSMFFLKISNQIFNNIIIICSIFITAFTILLFSAVNSKKLFQLIFNLPLIKKYKEKAEEIRLDFKESLKLFKNPLSLISVFLISFSVWIMEALVFRFVNLSFNIRMSFLNTLFLSLMSALLTAVPITAGGLGAVELFLSIALPIFAISKELAATVLLMFRVIVYWSMIIVGFFISIFKNPFEFNKSS